MRETSPFDSCHLLRYQPWGMLLPSWTPQISQWPLDVEIRVLVLTRFREPFQIQKQKKRRERGGDEGGVGPNRKGPLKRMPQEWICVFIELG